MLEIVIAQTVTPGHYLAIWKVIVFMIFFGLWAWVGPWLDKDAPAIKANRTFWNNIYLGTGVATLLLWFILPAPFIVELLFFLVVWTTVVVIYVMHRNARVPAEERILNWDHIQSLFARESQEGPSGRLVIISANKNELPIPHRQDAEYRGYYLAEQLIQDIYMRRVSLAEVIPVGDEFQLLYTIDGVKGKAGARVRDDAEQMIAYLKAASSLEVKERRRLQEGQFSIRIDEASAEWKVNTAGSTRGEQISLERVQQAQTLNIEALGFDADQLEGARKAIEYERGIVLVCGTAISGVTTTLYSMVRRHDAFIQNVNSLEIDLLTELDNITQNIVEKEAGGKSGGRQLQSVLRGDPDVVMVGFCSEREMAQYGTQAALEGKKLYFGLAQPTTFHGLQEWIKMVGDNEKVAQTLIAVTSQKLMRKLCPQCRQAYSPDPNLLKKLNLPADEIKQFFRPPPEIEHDKKGRPIVCPHCQGTGYFGRTAVFETLFVSESVRELIKGGSPINAIAVQCRKERMLYLQEQAIRRVIDGTTSIQEVLRVTVEKNTERAPSKRSKPKQS